VGLACGGGDGGWGGEFFEGGIGGGGDFFGGGSEGEAAEDLAIAGGEEQVGGVFDGVRAVLGVGLFFDGDAEGLGDASDVLGGAGEFDEMEWERVFGGAQSFWGIAFWVDGDEEGLDATGVVFEEAEGFV